MANLTETFRDARAAGTPLVAVETADQFAAMSAICNSENGAAKVLWDAERGVQGINDAGTRFLSTRGDAETLRQSTTNPQTALEVAEALPDDGLFFMLNAHRFVADAFVATGILNKREPFKASGRSLVLLGPKFDLPQELRQDVIVIDDPLPDDAALAKMIEGLLVGAGLSPTKDAARAVDAVRGLSTFAAEQVVAMSLRKSGIDIEALWDRKRAQVAQVKGLSLQKGGPRREDIGGNEAICDYAERVVNGEDSPRAIYLVDEIEKYMAGSGGQDASGVTADYLGVLLREMEDNGHDGLIALSPPGCGKTMFARSLAATFGLPLVQFDFGAMKGRYVGDSEAAIREAFKVANGIAAGRALVVATCNKLDNLPPELRRRFTNGIWFFDLPDAREREAIWRVQLKAHGLAVNPAGVNFDEGWTGAEIRNCCRIAARLKVTLAEAARYVVPVSQSDPASIEALRKLAEGRFLSANYPGVYCRNRKDDAAGRKVRLGKES
jgi:hypothetical protein